jgi:tRNA threonylcarbamoyladenosine biosynthesis protein TsaB
MFLAIETSTPLGSVAVGDGQQVLAEIVLGVQSRHSEALLPAIDFVLANAQVTKLQLTAVIVGGGPGSFTGLRIAGATAKALSKSLEIPLYAYSGLAALAAGSATGDKQICALFDARRGEVYSACYRFPEMNRIETIMEPAPRMLDDVLARLDANETLFVGDAALFAPSPDRLTAPPHIAPSHIAIPRASSLLWLQTISPAAGKVEQPNEWEPLYIRESGAERMKAR